MSNLFTSRKLKAAPKMLALSSAIFMAHSAQAVTPFSDSFEGLPVADMGTALSDLGWRVGANVYATVDASGNVIADPLANGFKFFFGLFDAPNGGPGFSSVATGDGHPGATDASGNYLNAYSQYECCDLGTATPQGHGNGTDIVNALLLKEFTIATGDIGSTVTFQFDVKRPEFADDGFGGDTSAAVANGCTGHFDASGNLNGFATMQVCDASGFIKTLDPSNGYATTNNVVSQTTFVSQANWTTVSIQLDLTDPLLDGQILQVGFQNWAQNFNNTGVYYDNVSMSVSGGPTPSVAVPVPAIAAGALGLLLAGVVTMRKRVTA